MSFNSLTASEEIIEATKFTVSTVVGRTDISAISSRQDMQGQHTNPYCEIVGNQGKKNIEKKMCILYLRRDPLLVAASSMLSAY